MPPEFICELEPCMPPWVFDPPWLFIVPELPIPGLFVVPPPIGAIVLLAGELLFRGVLLVVPTLPVGLAPPELMVVVADVPVCA
jgi:hypothetical protein